MIIIAPLLSERDMWMFLLFTISFKAFIYLRVSLESFVFLSVAVSRPCMYPLVKLK